MDRFDFLELDDKPRSAPPPPVEDVADTSSWKPVKIRAVETIGEYGNGPGQFSTPTALAVDRNGALFIVDSNNHRIQWIGLNGNVKRIGEPGSAPGELWGPAAIAIDPTNQFFYVADQGNNRIQCFSIEGQYRGMMNGFRSPSGLAFDASGRLWISDSGNSRVACMDVRSGQCLGSYEKNVGLIRPESIVITSTGSLYIADSGTQEVVCFAGGQRAGSRHFSSANQITVDKQNRLYVAEAGAGRLHVLDSLGESLLTYDLSAVKHGSLGQPSGVAIGPKDEIYVSDTLNHRVLHLEWE